MLDTVHLTTEHLEPGQYVQITEYLQERIGVNPASGEVDYRHYVATIAAPATGAPIRLQVRTSKWVKMPGDKSPHKVDGINSFRIEASVQKCMHGHNVFGGWQEPQSACAWLITLVSTMLEVELPDIEWWEVSRIDYALAFDLGSLDNVRGWIRSKSLVAYPRREVYFHGDVSFGSDGTTTSIRGYAKGAQFHKEGGYQALLKCRPAEYAFEVSRRAESILRCEIEIKPPKLDTLDAKICNVTQDWLEEIYDDEWRKLLRPIDTDSRIVHTAIEVYARLQEKYSSDRAWSLYLVWCVLAVRGETFYRSHVSSRAWREQRKLLEEAFVSWSDTNILTIDAPTDLQNFVPLLSATQRITEVLPLPE